jgi:hypothetical protein
MRLLTCAALALTLTLSAGFGQDPKKDDKKKVEKKLDDKKLDDKKPEVRKGEPVTKDWLGGKWKHPTDGRVSLTFTKDGKGSLSTVTLYMGAPTPSTVRFDYTIDEKTNFVTMTQGQAHIGTAERTKDGKLRVTAPHDGIRAVDFDRVKDDEKKEDKKPKDDKKETKKPKDETKPKDDKKDEKKPIKD